MIMAVIFDAKEKYSKEQFQSNPCKILLYID